MPKHLQNKFKENAFIAGGCIYSLHNDKTPHDFDFFVKDKDFANELLTYFKAQDVKPFKNLLQGKYNDLRLLITKYAISIGDKYQIVVKYIGEPRNVVEEFDFKHNMFTYCDNELNNYTSWDQLDSNKLVFNDTRARDLCGVLLRVTKFTNRGMTITKSEQAKILSKLCENGFDDAEKDILKTYTTY